MSQLDLNLLKVFRVLLDVKNTRKAGEILHMSQPGVSRALSRLRDYFSDDLFVRSAYGLVATEKAKEIGVHLPYALDNLMGVIESKKNFIPTNIKSKVSIAISGLLAQWLAPMLIKHIVKQAPNIELQIHNWEVGTPELISQGDIDIGVNYFPMELSKQLLQKKIGTDNFVIVTGKKHPLKSITIKANDFANYPMASLPIPNWNELKKTGGKALKSFGIIPKTQLRSSHLNIIFDAMLKTDILFPCSKKLAEQLPDTYKYFPIDSELAIPNGDFAIIVANQTRRHPLQRWLIDSIENCVKEKAI